MSKHYRTYARVAEIEAQHKAAQVRTHVAIAKLGLALGVELDPKRPDHEFLEELAERAQTHAQGHVASPGEYCDCTCAGCRGSGDA